MDSFDLLERTIENCLRINCRSYKPDYIRRRVQSRMRVLQVSDYEAYRHVLLSSPPETNELRDALTINVTRFFRDREVFEVIGREIIPEILSRKSRIRIWCAGCASGEEAYSLAILLWEYLKDHPECSGIVYATDIDRHVLQKAIEGTYDRQAFQEVHPCRVHDHFIPLGDGRYRISPRVKELIRFRYHDLMSGRPISTHLDLIACRNVTIYFTAEEKKRLTAMFHRALSNNGYYVMGKTEYLDRELQDLFEYCNPQEKVLKKLQAEGNR
ncbi:MAG: protein-glutamate O-methyltransferase CheR [Methanomicrobiales archaeon]|nr:protein-glutamate O-methyltransferase CheR [Methanomicrobiales archaeon]